MGKEGMSADNLFYKGKQLTFARLYELAREKGINVKKPVARRQLKRAGLEHPLELLAQAHVINAQEALRSAGFTTYVDAHYSTEQDLYKQLLAYNGGSKKKPINMHAMHTDKKQGGANLVSKIGRLAKKKYCKRTASLVIRNWGFKTTRENNTLEEIKEVLCALWPEERIKEVYQGNGRLHDIGHLKKINRNIYGALQARGIIRIINSLYPNYPDLYTYVRAPQSPAGTAHPDLVRTQLDSRYHSGLSIGLVLKKSPDTNERTLYKRVMSLAQRIRTLRARPAEKINGVATDEITKLPRDHYKLLRILRQLLYQVYPVEFVDKEMRFAYNASDLRIAKRISTLLKPSYVDIVHALLPDLRKDDIHGGTTKSEYRKGKIGNLYVEMLLKLTLAMDPEGKFYRNGFARIFKAPLTDVYAEKRIQTNGKTLAPDFLVVGKRNTAVEVKSGEHTSNPLSLVNKYDNKSNYSWNIDDESYPLENKIAILHMPTKVFNQVRSNLTDSGYTVIGADQFSEYLEDVLDKLETSKWQNHLSQAAPRLHNVRSLLSFYDDFAHKPARITRNSYEELTTFVSTTLKNIVQYNWSQAA